MPAISNKKTVTTAGTAVVLGTGIVNGPIAIKALNTNTGIVTIGNDGAGDVTTSNGFILLANEVIIIEFIGVLESLWLDSAVNGEGVTWLHLNV